ncbi:MAG: hypothetical protein EA402_14490 [Planctomycetota bacterium]|nr:MAG: hypothetical protein EA402_14490 [Planctomycetota bacterium]
MIACPTLYELPAEDRAAIAALDPALITAAQASASPAGGPPRGTTIAAVFEVTLDPVAEDGEAPSNEATQPEAKAPAGGGAPRRRRHIDRSQQWPAVGTRLVGDYLGERFEAEVIESPRLKSGRALKLLTQPVRGAVCNSMSKAMDLATLGERQRRGVKGKTGLPGSGWDFWKPAA